MNTTIALITTSSTPTGGVPLYAGFIAAIAAGIGYGLNYLPVKKFETGDGMFFQWILTNAIFIGSFIVYAILGFPPIHALVLLGGFLWATGNICVVPVIREIGLGMGLCLWGSMSILMGWASARFGWFGIDPQLPKSDALNYIGFVFIAISPLIYSLVKTEMSEGNDERDAEMDTIMSLKEDAMSINNGKMTEHYWKIRIFIQKFKPKIIGVSLSIFSGTMYGLMFIPVTYVKNRYPGASQKDIDHLFAQCLGIYLGGSIYFVIYCLYMRNNPFVYPKAILPGLLSGTIWFLSYVVYFVANESLSPAISQPIIGALPGLISLMLGVFWFKEIRGLRNYLILIPATVISTTGVTLTGLSKVL